MDNSVLMEMGAYMSAVNGNKGLSYFKLACLKSKCTIYEDDLL